MHVFVRTSIILAAFSGAASAQAAPPVAPPAPITSSFDVDSDGWAIGSADASATVRAVGSAPWRSGGPTGGYLQTTDSENIVAFFAPAKFLGDKGSFYGQTISFDSSDTVNDGDFYTSLIFYGNGQAISIGSLPPATSLLGTRTTFNLVELDFDFYTGSGIQRNNPVNEAQFRAILGNLTNIALHADWNTGVDDFALDNFTFGTVQAPPPAVPEPGTWLMLIAGFGLVGAALRRRRMTAAA